MAGLLFTGIIYVSGYILLLFVAICLACGLYYLAEVAEEHSSRVKQGITTATLVVLVVHVLLLLLESLPWMAVGIGFATHLCYLWLLSSFPILSYTSPQAVASLVMLGLSNWCWLHHFLGHYHQAAHILCFFFFNVWLVPAGLFVSLGSHDSVLPDSLGGRGKGGMHLGKGV